jgi:hypothetical protein
MAAIAACSFSNLEHLSDGPVDAGADSGAPAPDPDGAVSSGSTADAGDSGLLTPGLVGWWQLDETSGSVAADSSTLRNPGVLVGGPTWLPAAGAQPGALQFDGADDYVEIGGNVVYATQHAAFSFSAWFNVTDFASDIDPDIMQLRTDNDTPWHVIVSSDPRYQGITVGSATVWAPIMTGTTPSTGQWHHLAVTYDGTDPSAISSFRIVLDGASQPLRASNGYGAQPEGSRIGGSTEGNPWKGFIRDVRIYNRLLTSAEIAALYASR